MLDCCCFCILLRGIGLKVSEYGDDCGAAVAPRDVDDVNCKERLIRTSAVFSAVSHSAILSLLTSIQTPIKYLVLLSLRCRQS